MTKTSSQKEFFLSEDEIAPIYMGYGGCLATDKIVCEGMKVGYMFRESPITPLDSGWRFFSGDEDKNYMNNNLKHGVYDLNTIVNYDPDIMELLSANIGSKFERNCSGVFEKIPFELR